MNYFVNVYVFFIIIIILISEYYLISGFPFLTDLNLKSILNPMKQINKDPKCLYFSGAGIYFWWQLGAAKYMKENCEMKYIQEKQIIGASAGSITATLLLTDANLDTLPKLAIDLGNQKDLYSRKTGLAGIWGILLKQWLEEVIPDNLNLDALSNLEIAITPTLLKPKLISNFKDKEDLINCIMASCHVPIFLDGRPYTQYRGENVIDGSFWYFVTKDRLTGLPLPTNINIQEDIFWIDYTDDEDFMLTVSGNFLELANPQGIYDMIDSGYNFMKREHFGNRLPFVKYNKPNFVTLSSRLATNIPENIKDVVKKINYSDIYKIQSLNNKSNLLLNN